MRVPNHEVTDLLQAWGGGDPDARDRLVPLVYQELRRRAAAHLRRERREYTLQPTALALDDAAAAIGPAAVDALDLDDALTGLARFDERKSQVAEMRFFGGMSFEETADALGISVATLERDWQAARAWLFKTLSAPRCAAP